MRFAGLLLLLAGCGCEKETPPTKAPRNDPPAIEWKSATYGSLKLSLPAEWLKDHRKILSQYFFFGPEDDGFKPNFQILWKKSPMTIERWALINREKEDNPNSPSRVFEQGWTTIGGRRAYYMVYEKEDRDPGRNNATARFGFIDWYLQYDGHVGMVRGLSRRESFALGYRPLFERFAARIRYVPAR